jgi:hypothetical protein
MRLGLAILLLMWGTESALHAQNLTGQWAGNAVDNVTNRKQKLVFTISEADSSFGGVLHWYFPETRIIRHIIVKGRYYGKDSILTIVEDSVTRNSGASPGNRGGEVEGDPAVGEGKARAPVRQGFYIFYYKKTGRKEVLEGHWKDYRVNAAGGHGDIEIRLEKKAPPFIPVALSLHKKKDSAQQKQYQALLERQSPVAATLPIRGSDSVKIALYDNGEIDGDSVSLYLNNDVVLQHLKLTAEAKTLFLPIDRSLPVNKLVLFAENLGTLPPNTALMEVTVGGKTYNLFLSTDYKRNAMVEFTLQE